jgi:catechol-2,3-dioxygenase
MVYIYGVHMSSSGQHHQHIASVRWRNPDTGKAGQASQAEMVDYVNRSNTAVYVCGGGGHMARVGVVKDTPPYIRTHADGVWSDNLLALPRY